MIFMSKDGVTGIETTNRKLSKAILGENTFEKRKDIELPNLSYADRVDGDVRVTLFYFQEAFRLLAEAGLTDKARLKVAKEYPVTIEGKGFRIVIAPCIESAGVEE